MANVYDLVRYPNWPVLETHPVTLGVFAALFGRRFAPFHACRMLEIGCGEGVNLMSMAIGAPASEFVRIDLVEAPIAKGRAMVQASGLANVTLQVQDIMQADVPPGEFDYIIAHGVYAWVAAPVRAALMRLVGKCLRSDGLAFISYDVHPGCRVRSAAELHAWSRFCRGHVFRPIGYRIEPGHAPLRSKPARSGAPL